MSVLLVALGAGIGAAVRFTLAQRLDGAWHRGTLLANVAASFVLGLVVGAELGRDLGLLLGTGFCGGLSTYSAFAVQTHGQGPRRGTAYAAVTLGGALLAVSLGWLIGQA